MTTSAVASPTTEPTYVAPAIEMVLTEQQLLTEIEYGAALTCETVNGLTVCV